MADSTNDPGNSQGSGARGNPKPRGRGGGRPPKRNVSTQQAVAESPIQSPGQPAMSTRRASARVASSSRMASSSTHIRGTPTIHPAPASTAPSTGTPLAPTPLAPTPLAPNPLAPTPTSQPFNQPPRSAGFYTSSEAFYSTLAGAPRLPVSQPGTPSSFVRGPQGSISIHHAQPQTPLPLSTSVDSLNAEESPLPAGTIDRVQRAITTNDAVKELLAAYPYLFAAPFRVNLFALKEKPKVRVDWDPKARRFKVSKTKLRGVDVGNEASLAMNPNMTLTNLSAEDKDALLNQLDIHCRKYQFLFHGPHFIMDAIFRVYGNVQLTPSDVWSFRSKTQEMHSDFQNKFLWQGFLKWCQDFVISKTEVLELAQQDFSPEFAREMRDVLLPQLSKPTFQSIWKFCEHLIDYEVTFGDKTSLPFFFMRIIFTTLAPMMFKLIVKEKALNASRAPGTRTKLDSTYREEIRGAYHALAFEPRFQNVDIDIFTWVEKPVKKVKSSETDQVLAKTVWDDEQPPPPPTGYVARTVDSPGSNFSLTHAFSSASVNSPLVPQQNLGAARGPPTMPLGSVYPDPASVALGTPLTAPSLPGPNQYYTPRGGHYMPSPPPGAQPSGQPGTQPGGGQPGTQPGGQPGGQPGAQDDGSFGTQADGNFGTTRRYLDFATPPHLDDYGSDDESQTVTGTLRGDESPSMQRSVRRQQFYQ